MLLRLGVALLDRWRALTTAQEVDRGDSPVPTVIIWIGLAVIAIGLIAWAGTYVSNLASQAPTTIPSPPTP
ncbi:MAG TPA: hypothetical protein VKB69_08890 [Micromonosporaceae bacterium]|nr:hypothetical protein [Micromonosporaceae bacterium]